MKEFKRPTSRTSQDDEVLQETPQILSSEEKRELILAHARSQTSKDPMQRMTVWGGVMIAMAGIAVGWWWTVGASIHGTMRQGMPELKEMTKNLDDFTKTVQNESDSLKQPLSPTNSANASEYSGVLKAVLEGNAEKNKRDDLLAPHRNTAKATSSTVENDTDTTTDTQAPTPLIDPSTPGLTPEQSASN